MRHAKHRKPPALTVRRALASTGRCATDAERSLDNRRYAAAFFIASAVLFSTPAVRSTALGRKCRHSRRRHVPAASRSA